MLTEDTKILVVEGDADMRDAMRRGFASMRFTNVQFAVDTDEARERLIVEDFKCVVAHSIDLLTFMRRHRRCRSTPFVLMDDPEHPLRTKALVLGANGSFPRRCGFDGVYEVLTDLFTPVGALHS